MPAAVDHGVADVAEPVARDHERSAPRSVVYRPRLLGRPAGAATAKRNLGVITEMHHQARVIDATAAPALARRGERRRVLHDSGSRHRGDCAHCF